MEYKFRGKEIASNEWYYGDLIIDEGRYYICLQVNDHIKRDDYEVYMVEVIPETIGQYTGLKDKNGKEIYKGDVWEDEDGYYIIAWDEKYACFSVDVYGFNQWIGEGGQECYGNKIEFLDREGFEAFIFTGIEITKNIYDNP